MHHGRSGPRLPGLGEERLMLVWSNPDAPSTVLIAKAIESRSFNLILWMAREYGIDAVSDVARQLRDEQAVPAPILDYAENALRNIRIGAARAASRAAEAAPDQH